jgi:hypothetical protein
VVLLVLFVSLVALLGLFLYRRSQSRDLFGKAFAPKAGPDTTLLVTDVQVR